ncbi:FAD-binding domain-containing protein OS=Streptomyces microflavus OX=1919 GN=Smic_43650 PE=3 SV=1 [Streptomyces microflavus]
MEILDQRGLLERDRNPAGRAHGPLRPALPLDLRLPGPYPGQWKVPQTRTEEVLGAWAVRLGAEVRRGRRVTGLEQRPDRVTVEAAGPEGGAPVRITAPYSCRRVRRREDARRAYWLTAIAFPGNDAENGS